MTSIEAPANGLPGAGTRLPTPPGQRCGCTAPGQLPAPPHAAARRLAVAVGDRELPCFTRELLAGAPVGPPGGFASLPAARAAAAAASWGDARGAVALLRGPNGRLVLHRVVLDDVDACGRPLAYHLGRYGEHGHAAAHGALVAIIDGAAMASPVPARPTHPTRPIPQP